MDAALFGAILGFVSGVLWVIAVLLRRKIKPVPLVRPEPALAGGVMTLNESNKYTAETRARDAEAKAAEPIERRNRKIDRIALIIEVLAALSTAGTGVAAYEGYFNDAKRWNPLTSTQAAALAKELSRIPPEPMQLGCAIPADCKELTMSIGEAFTAAGWTDIKYVFSGGIGIGGIVGLRMDPGDERTEAVDAAIERATTLKVTRSEDLRQPSYPPGATLVIGTKP